MVKHCGKQLLEQSLVWAGYVWKQVRNDVRAHWCSGFTIRFVTMQCHGYFYLWFRLYTTVVTLLISAAQSVLAARVGVCCFGHWC